MFDKIYVQFSYSSASTLMETNLIIQNRSKESNSDIIYQVYFWGFASFALQKAKYVLIKLLVVSIYLLCICKQSVIQKIVLSMVYDIKNMAQPKWRLILLCFNLSCKMKFVRQIWNNIKNFKNTISA